jgi:uncharacterized protein YhfF
VRRPLPAVTARSMPEGLCPEQAAFWAAFLGSPAAPKDAEARFHSVFGVGSGGDEGAALILSRAKTATSSLPSEFAPDAAPVPGSLSLLTGAKCRPLAVVETLSICSMTLASMGDDFIKAYAEWPDRDAFVRGMTEWYQGLDPDFTADSPLLAERFRVIWP